ncbi:uncharacterized protein [Venturia canescens]|uniref:uncharacterized protein n=1 Tax=Venturia canescens TaxID=32260 RepID=UPI001C9D45BD|nr:uncharacterized protein LOC122411456 [Venturia canescens]
MGSSRGEDHSLSSGISLPQWMKGRGDARYEFDHTSFSPPSHDDNFFCIRYAIKPSKEKSNDNTATASGQDGYRSISQVLNENTNSNVTVVHANNPPSSSTNTSSDLTNIKDFKNIDFSKHPLPCQPFVPAAGGKEANPAAFRLSNKTKIAKSQGTDDGFHSEPALCGKSIVHVANRMMSKKLAKFDTVNEAAEGLQNNATMEEQLRNEKQLMRRGSKSLPVTPIASPTSTPDTSPKSRRRGNTNRYFTGTFDRDNKYQTGWLLSSILGQSREFGIGTSHKIQEVDEDEAPPLDVVPSKFLSRKKSISSQNLSYLGRNEEQRQQLPQQLQPQQQQQQQSQQRDDDSKKESSIYTNVFRAKPSELREMNFWSPTSM